MPVAQLNIARPKFALDAPEIADFMNALDRVNAIAERSDGFLWRLTGEGNDATSLNHPAEPGTIVNMSAWRDVDSLQRFVWTTIHRRFFDRKAEWFTGTGDRDFVMWSVPDGAWPTLDEAFARLARLRRDGSTDHAFGWEHVKTERWLGKVVEGDG
ncbi:MAG: DUF3291 domain-containing protein [Pseudomonadota bacterium]